MNLLSLLRPYGEAGQWLQPYSGAVRPAFSRLEIIERKYVITP
jgi:hypothetical protein